MARTLLDPSSGEGLLNASLAIEMMKNLLKHTMIANLEETILADVQRAKVAVAPIVFRRERIGIVALRCMVFHQMNIPTQPRRTDTLKAARSRHPPVKSREDTAVV
jgi:hypothetical protein